MLETGSTATSSHSYPMSSMVSLISRPISRCVTRADPHFPKRSTVIWDTPVLSFNASIIALTQAAQVIPPIDSDTRYWVNSRGIPPDKSATLSSERLTVVGIQEVSLVLKDF